ncbi:dihydropteroate synthase-like protein [Methanomicrobium sp. W14]|uniref:dihydropteroate synthase-like protein n=1 Tax=Methanomicrobium sp. W14 TaxID=2817839 RepID=UPI001AE1E006|nr:dihydropteroate synthase-like protein [Methanomicrobium sp. W14]MBP2133783.1 dihydropteroate synthase-like protein [Methanomicrobium sp. W14]
MKILLPTGSLAYPIVKEASKGFDVRITVSGKIAAFLTPATLKRLVLEEPCDMVLVSGMCSADFSGVERETGVPVFMGPRHAADLGIVLGALDSLILSKSVPADELISESKKRDAYDKLETLEKEADYDFEVKGLKIGKKSRIKVLAEIMDAHKQKKLKEIVEYFFKSGADIVDLGFGFDASPEDVAETFESLKNVKGIFACDTQDPGLIRTAIPYADIFLSLHENNIPLVAGEIAKAQKTVVIVPLEKSLDENINEAKDAGIEKIIADPLLQPAGSGLVKSLEGFRSCKTPLFFGAGNVTELIDADSPGVNALLAGMAKELNASVIFTSEHSDKTKGSVREMRRAVEMMALMTDRPYPKDLGISLFCIKEKRRRITPTLDYKKEIFVDNISRHTTNDPAGNVKIGTEGEYIVAVHKGTAFKAKKWQDIFDALMESDRVSLLDHAAYLGKELYKAELSIKFNRSFDQDGHF